MGSCEVGLTKSPVNSQRYNSVSAEIESGLTESVAAMTYCDVGSSWLSRVCGEASGTSGDQPIS